MTQARKTARSIRILDLVLRKIVWPERSLQAILKIKKPNQYFEKNVLKNITLKYMDLTSE